jgi:hypothetical protein
MLAETTRAVKLLYDMLVESGQSKHIHLQVGRLTAPSATIDQIFTITNCCLPLSALGS